MGIKTNVVEFVFAVALGMLSVAGCGYSSASDGLSTPDTPDPTMDIATMKEAALSNLANGIQPTVNAGNGCIAELTVDPMLQRIVSDVLSRHADTNDTAIGWAVLMSANDGAVLALADCGWSGLSYAPKSTSRPATRALPARSRSVEQKPPSPASMHGEAVESLQSPESASAKRASSSEFAIPSRRGVVQLKAAMQAAASAPSGALA